MFRNIELDLQISENLFGIKKVYKLEYLSDSYEYIPSGKPYRTHHIDAKSLPEYSASGGMYVVYKMMEHYHWCIRSPFEKDKEWFAGLTPLGATGFNGKPDFNASGHSMMEAICKVALLALGDKITNKIKVISIKE